MLKKKVGSLIAVSALSAAFGLGFAADKADAASWNNSSISQSQGGTGWSSYFGIQQKSVNSNESTVNSSSGEAVGQAAFVSGSQSQAGSSNGPATASQSQNTSIDVGENVAGNGQGTTVNSSSTQTVDGPAKFVQTQNRVNATFSFSGSIEGGPTIQKQINQNNSYQSFTRLGK